MKANLNFVKGAVSTKDLVPVLTNFHFYDGRVQGGNGRISIDAPCGLTVGDITVPAVPFLRALEACDGDPTLAITPGGKLTMKKGSFRSALPLAEHDAFPKVGCDLQEMNKVFKPRSDLLTALRTIRPFVGHDASRPWACGVLFKDGYLYATNNVVMVRLPWEMEGTINLPSFAVDELLRINETPKGFAFNDKTAAFIYDDAADSRWLRSQLFEAQWPDVDAFFTEPATEFVPEGLLGAIQKILPFCSDSKNPTITLDETGVHTAEGDMSAEVVGQYQLPEGRYRAEPLQLVLSQATKINLTKWPKPVPFAGENGLQGVIVGVRA